MASPRAVAAATVSRSQRVYAVARRDAVGRLRRLRERLVTERLREKRLESLQSQQGLLLDLGASSAHIPGWISLDIDPDSAGIRMDARESWPFRDAIARAVRAEHVIEHLTFDEAAFCIREVFRVLQPGGTCRICTPDLEGIVRAYLSHDPHILTIHREHGYQAPTWSHLPNNYMRMWGHQYVFDFEALQTLLEDAGFADVERTAFNRSRHPLLDGTDSHDPGDLERLVVCVDAVKPAKSSSQ